MNSNVNTSKPEHIDRWTPRPSQEEPRLSREGSRLSRDESLPSREESRPDLSLQPTRSRSKELSAVEKQWTGTEWPAARVISMPISVERPAGHDASSNSSLEALTTDGEGNTYPEGGLQGWLVVFGSFIGMFACFGMMNSIGVFQAYVSKHQLRDYDESTIGWVFSVYVFLSFFCGIQIGPVFDAKGPKLLMLAGSVLITASMLLLGLCTEYYQLMLVFGILGGLGTSLIFTPAVSAIGHFFLVRRGLATGIAAGGGAVGGVVFPLMLQSLLGRLSFAWTTRIIGFIFAACTALSTLLVRSRLAPKPGSSVLPDFRIFRRKSFALTTLGVYMMEWGLFVPVSYLTSFALASGSMSSEFAYQLIAIFNAGSVIGRWLPGYLADRYGRFNFMTAALFVCGLTTLALWLPADVLIFWTEKDESASVMPLTVLFAVLFGMASGSNISVTPVCVGQLCETEEYGRYYATCYSVVAIGTLTGIPIAGVLLQVCNGDYWGVIAFTGACYVVSVVAFVWARALEVGWGWRAIY